MPPSPTCNPQNAPAVAAHASSAVVPPHQQVGCLSAHRGVQRAGVENLVDPVCLHLQHSGLQNRVRPEAAQTSGSGAAGQAAALPRRLPRWHTVLRQRPRGIASRRCQHSTRCSTRACIVIRMAPAHSMRHMMPNTRQTAGAPAPLTGHSVSLWPHRLTPSVSEMRPNWQTVVGPCSRPGTLDSYTNRTIVV